MSLKFMYVRPLNPEDELFLLFDELFVLFADTEGASGASHSSQQTTRSAD